MSRGETEDLAGRKVLVAETNAAARQSMVTALADAGFEVIAVASAMAVAEAMVSDEPDLFVLGAELDDAFAICRAIRASDGSARVPVLIATDEDDTTSNDEAFGAGATDFVVTPIEWPVFIRHIRHIMRAHLHYEALLESQARNRSIVEAIPDRVMLVNGAGDIVERLSRSSAEDGKHVANLTDLISGDAASRVLSMLKDVIEHGRMRSAEFGAANNDSGEYFVEARLVPHDDEHALVILRDISEQRRAEAKLQKLAEFDELTGLPNRQFFAGLLSRALEQGARRDRLVAILSLDLDRFQRVNSTFGRATGDRIIRQVARRLQVWRGRWASVSGLKSEPFVGRLGSDEFAVLLPDLIDADTVYSTLESLRSSVEVPIRWAKGEVVVSFTAGIALNTDGSADAAKLIDQAEAAASRAKQQAQASEHLYSGVQDAKEFDRLYLEREFRQALKEGKVQLAYQPKINLRTGEMETAEALARWHHPIRGAISPGDFVPIAEELGLSHQLGNHVLKVACDQIARWQQAFESSPGISVNISAAQFSRGGVVDSVRHAIESAQIDPALLEIEVTEGALMRQGGETEHMLAELKSLGVRISVDDFGTGYSSLSYLKRFPIDALKIDQSFVADLDDDEQSLAIVEAVIAMGHGLNLEVIAEGIERRSQYLALRDLGCDVGQGFWFARALPPNELEPLLKRNFLEPQALPWQHETLVTA